ncbi:hypothetical protein BHM03_00053420, partial [Ensete ventricosum]
TIHLTSSKSESDTVVSSRWAAQSSPPHVPSPLPASNGSSTRVAPVGGVGPTAEGKVPWRSDGDGRAMSRRVGALSGHGKGCHLFPGLLHMRAMVLGGGSHWFGCC